jgi:hypothetical protein
MITWVILSFVFISIFLSFVLMISLCANCARINRSLGEDEANFYSSDPPPELKIFPTVSSTPE